MFHYFFGQPIKIFWEDCRLPHRVNNAATTKSVTTACLHWLSQPEKADRTFIFAFQRWIKVFVISFRLWFNHVWWIRLSRGICCTRGWHGAGIRNEPKNSWLISATLHVWWSLRYLSPQVTIAYMERVGELFTSVKTTFIKGLWLACDWSPVIYDRFTHWWKFGRETPNNPSSWIRPKYCLAEPENWLKPVRRLWPPRNERGSITQFVAEWQNNRRIVLWKQ